ncbi:hypothetical protein N7522_006221 [Penicillium canescens]|nr:hypothetical protein N7522_006221 [Penicillium canescens]KAJ6060951.1 hypothetical protein N7444_001647 [Penicillium canescens]KAJ6174342.1 hypothetical protein N7485_005642 [Penicillium canescens]
MCFYNQKRFSCGDWNWTRFAHRCDYEYRIGETCGIRLINETENCNSKCHLCKKIETKYRRRRAEEGRLGRWEREGTAMFASMDRARKAIMDLDIEIFIMQQEQLQTTIIPLWKLGGKRRVG